MVRLQKVEPIGMAILTKGTVLTLSTSLKVVDMFVFDHVVYYLAKFVSREGIVAVDLADIPLILICTDPDVISISEAATTFAKMYVASKYSEDQ